MNLLQSFFNRFKFYLFERRSKNHSYFLFVAKIKVKVIKLVCCCVSFAKHWAAPFLGMSALYTRKSILSIVFAKIILMLLIAKVLLILLAKNLYSTNIEDLITDF